MSSSPGGTEPATSTESQSLPRTPAVSQATCLAGPPTLSRAITRTIFISNADFQLPIADWCSFPGADSQLRISGQSLTAREHKLANGHLAIGNGGFVRPGFRNKIRRALQAFESTGVCPPPIKFFPGHFA